MSVGERDRYGERVSSEFVHMQQEVSRDFEFEMSAECRWHSVAGSRLYDMGVPFSPLMFGDATSSIHSSLSVK